MTATPIVLDCDPGHDNAIALLLALASPELELLAVTTTHGNTTIENATANAIRVLDLAGRSDVPVARGAEEPLARELYVAKYVHGESGLDGPTLPPPSREPDSDDAVDFLVDLLWEREDRVTLVPTGPLTNIALLLERDVHSRIERIVLMGGAIAEGNVTPAAEFNIWADPEAAAAVFASGIDVTMIGLDVTHKALLTLERAEALRDRGKVLAFVANLFAFYHQFHHRTYGWDGSPIHDAVAVAHVFAQGLVETKQRNVEIELESELCRGRTVVDLWDRTDRPKNTHVGVDIDGPRFLDLLEERLASLG